MGFGSTALGSSTPGGAIGSAVAFHAEPTLSSIRSGNTTIVTATSSLSGIVYYFWYLDGAYVGMTTSNKKAFNLLPGDQAQIVVLDSNYSTFDPIGNAPAGYPARRVIVWARSIDPNIYQYRIEQRAGAGAWTILGYVKHDVKEWIYEFLSPRLIDLSTYTWRVVAMDLFGNDGAIATLSSELIVRNPDAPAFSATLQVSTQVLFAAA